MKSIRNTLALLAFTAGILTAVFIGFNPVWWFLFFLLIFTGAVILMIFNRRAVGWAVLFCLFCLAGFLFSGARHRFNNDLQRNRIYNKQTVILEGVQIKRSEKTTYGEMFLFLIRTGTTPGPAGKVIVFCRGPASNNWYGRKLQVNGIFRANPDERRMIPGYLENRGITGAVFAGERPVLLKGAGLPFPYILADRLRQSMLKPGRRFLKPANARLLQGMIFSDRLSDEASDRRLVNALRRTGTIHLLSVSGLHVAFLVAGLTFLLSQLKMPKKWQIIPITAGVWFYIMMTGMDPPVLRAGIMILIFTCGKLLGANDNPVNSLSLAALVLLFFNPYNLFEISFQLSFIATLGVVWLYPLLKEYFPVNHPILKPLWNATLIAICAQIMVTPLTVYYFQQISWISPVVNLLLILPAEFIVVGGLIGEGLALLLPWLGNLLVGVDWNLTIVCWIVEYFGGQYWAASWSPSWPWPWMAGYYLGLLLCLDLLRPNLLIKKRRLNAGLIIIAGLTILNLVIWAGVIQYNREKYLELAVIDVGQGDALFVRSPKGRNLLIDGGDEGKGMDKVVTFLRSIGVNKLNLVLATHSHSDHISGLAEVLEEVPAQKLFLPLNKDSLEVKELIKRIQPFEIPYETAYIGQKLSLGTGVSGEILAAPGMEDENDRSWVVLIKYGKNKLLLTGDLSAQGEAILARKYPDILKASVLKIGHHGSNYASGLRFISQVKPKAAIISVGAGNRFGHPGAATLNRLRSLGINVYRTDRQGTIIVKLYGDRFTVSSLK